MRALKQTVGTLDQARTIDSNSGAIKRRLELRKYLPLPALIAFADGANSIECTILDMSDQGARVEFPKDSRFPSAFQLISPTQGKVYDATVVWCGTSEVGVVFI